MMELFLNAFFTVVAPTATCSSVHGPSGRLHGGVRTLVGLIAVVAVVAWSTGWWYLNLFSHASNCVGSLNSERLQRDSLREYSPFPNGMTGLGRLRGPARCRLRGLVRG